MPGVRQILADFGAAMAADPGPLERHYTPDRLPAIREEVAHLEAELDNGWPGWRNHEPFHLVGPELMAWIKVRLKQLDLLRQGKADWGVKIVGTGRNIFAVSVKPAPLHKVQLAEVYDMPVSSSILAEALHVSDELVDQAIAEIRTAGARVTRRAIRAVIERFRRETLEKQAAAKRAERTA